MYKIYTKENCSYCRAAKDLLNRKHIQFIEYIIGVNATKEMLLEVLPDVRTVPQIFYGNQYVGGYEELLERIGHDDEKQFLRD